MSDPQSEAPETQRRPEVSDELTRSLSSIWERHAGERPSDVSIEISGDVVKFVIRDAGSGGPDGDGSAPAEGLSPDSPGYQHEVITAVARITRRRVRGFIPKRDTKTDVASDTYILEPVHIAR
ncbi:MAG: hypothetical protein ACRDLO_02470 [Solirubrobacterales bacterium]